MRALFGRCQLDARACHTRALWLARARGRRLGRAVHERDARRRWWPPWRRRWRRRRTPPTRPVVAPVVAIVVVEVCVTVVIVVTTAGLPVVAPARVPILSGTPVIIRERCEWFRLSVTTRQPQSGQSQDTGQRDLRCESRRCFHAVSITKVVVNQPFSSLSMVVRSTVK
jgi:hypothetical protein